MRDMTVSGAIVVSAAFLATFAAYEPSSAATRVKAPLSPAASAALKARISTLPATTVELKKAPVDKVVQPQDVGADKSGAVAAKPPVAVGAARPSGATRYVPLPVPEQRATKELLAQQLSHIKPARADLPAFVPFHGAVVTQTKDASEVTLIPVVYVDDPLRFNAAANRFEGRIAVGLVELGFKGPAKALPWAVAFQVLGDATTIPELTDVSSTSPPFKLITVAANDPRDKVDLKVFSTGMEPVTVGVPVERAHLVLNTKTRLQGWGLESAVVTVSASNGSASKGQAVVLQAPALGTLSTQTLRLAEDGTNREVTLRSESTGSVELVANSATLAPATLRVDFEFPLRFLIAAIAGGLAGGLLRRGVKRSGNYRRLALELLLSVLTGAVVLALYVLGVNVIGFKLPSSGGEVLVFVVSAVGAFLGTQVLQPKVPAKP